MKITIYTEGQNKCPVNSSLKKKYKAEVKSEKNKIKREYMKKLENQGRLLPGTPMTSFVETTNLNCIIIHTDGSCNPKDKTGGWSFICNEYEEYSGAENTTNNRMELTAVLKALEYVKRENLQEVIIVSDSQYVIKGCLDWVYVWFKGGKLNKLDLKNPELWGRVYTLIKELKNIDFRWTKGHVGNEMNEKVDKLANKGRKELNNASRLQQNESSEVLNKV